MTTWFTSDTHFGHPLLAVLRGFISEDWLREEYQRRLAINGREYARTFVKDYASLNHKSMKSLADTASHDAQIIRNINGCVNEDDDLWILGDIGFRTTIEYINECLQSLRCEHLHMVIGNHDFNFHDRAKDSLYESSFEDIHDNITLRLPILATGKTSKTNLSHFPYLQDLGSSWDGDTVKYASDALSNDSNVLLYGHTHSTSKAGASKNSLHVGLDAWDLHPVSLEDTRAWFESNPIQ